MADTRDTGAISDQQTDASNADNIVVRDLKVRPRHHIVLWTAAIILLLLAALLIISVVRNQRFQWGIIWSYLFNGAILRGVRNTILLTVISTLIALILGLGLALASACPNPILIRFYKIYVWFFRGVPQLVQLIFWFNLAALYPTLSVGLPFTAPLIAVPTNSVINGWVAATLGIALCEAAYMAEIIRNGIVSVPRGQVEAASALGVRSQTVFTRVVLPQAMRIIVPPAGNEIISLLKMTSLVSVISVPEILFSAQVIAGQTYQVIPMLIVASIWYLIIVSAMMALQGILERSYSSRDSSASAKDQDD
ncbi:MAG: amino acid ABC transporter permease [Acidipropionibacterium sp.]|jgi:polar amino acid transport system permease protein|nr:amino acid ABC transporter permease [Acidipropionibacterium sp.]